MDITKVGSPSSEPSAPTTKPARLPGQPDPQGASAAPGASAQTKPIPMPQPVIHSRTELTVDKSINRVVARVIDEDTGEEIREVPTKGLRRLYAAIRETLEPLVDESA